MMGGPHFLLMFVMKELVFFDERGDGRIGSMATALLITVAEKSDTARQTIGRMTKYNIPRFLRLTDVTVDDTNYGKSHSIPKNAYFLNSFLP